MNNLGFECLAGAQDDLCSNLLLGLGLQYAPVNCTIFSRDDKQTRQQNDFSNDRTGKKYGL